MEIKKAGMTEAQQLVGILLGICVMWFVIGIEKVFGERHSAKIHADICRFCDWIDGEEKDNA